MIKNIFRFLLIIFIAYSLDATTLAQANQAFLNKNYQEAALAYESALADQPSESGHFNAGQTYQNLNEHGLATFHYLQALKLGGNSTGALDYLFSLYEKIGYKLPSSDSFYKFVYLLSPQEWLLLATVCGWIGGGAFMWFGFAKKRRTPSILIVLSLTTLIPAIVSLLYFHKQADQAIVLKDTVIKVSPTSNAEEIIPIPPAAWITVHREMNGHYEVSIKGHDRKGWLSSSDARKIW